MHNMKNILKSLIKNSPAIASVDLNKKIKDTDKKIEFSRNRKRENQINFLKKNNNQLKDNFKSPYTYYYNKKAINNSIEHTYKLKQDSDSTISTHKGMQNSFELIDIEGGISPILDYIDESKWDKYKIDLINENNCKITFGHREAFVKGSNLTHAVVLVESETGRAIFGLNMNGNEGEKITNDLSHKMLKEYTFYPSTSITTSGNNIIKALEDAEKFAQNNPYNGVNRNCYTPLVKSMNELAKKTKNDEVEKTFATISIEQNLGLGVSNNKSTAPNFDKLNYDYKQNNNDNQPDNTNVEKCDVFRMLKF